MDNKEKHKPFEIICGSYEEFLLGYQFSPKTQEIVQTFAAHDHTASIRSTAVYGQYLASGGADDRIFIYDMKERKEICSLTHHNATINCLQFTQDHSHLISGSADGVLAMVRLGNWQVEKIWEKAHKGTAILDIALHSSGKLLLTLGADCTLVTWNLIKGRKAYVLNLKNKSKQAQHLEKILWASDGVRFILYGGLYTEIWSIETGGVLKQITHKTKVSSCIWVSDNEILLGFENGLISRINIESDETTDYKEHTSRVKTLTKYNNYFISTTSNGEIKVWSKKMTIIATQETGCRLTCVCIIPSYKIKEEEPEGIVQENSVEEIEEQPSDDDQVIENVAIGSRKRTQTNKQFRKKKKKC